jgi:hypothetical protein
MPKPKWTEIPQGYNVLVYSPYESSWVAVDETGRLDPRYYGYATDEERGFMHPEWRWNDRWEHVEERPNPDYLIHQKLDAILEGIDWIKDWLRND